MVWHAYGKSFRQRDIIMISRPRSGSAGSCCTHLLNKALPSVLSSEIAKKDK
jgi:hypothetical protein